MTAAPWIVLLALLLPPASNQETPPAAAAGFASDLDLLLERIESQHPAFTHAHSRAEFQRAAAEIRARLPGLDADGFAVETMRLMRLLEDGHSSFVVPRSALARRAWPLALGDFAEGVFVTAAAPPLAEAVGRRVVAIGGRPIEEVLIAADGVSFGDNGPSRRRHALMLLRLLAVDRALGLLEAPDRSSFEVAMEEGAARRFVLDAPAPLTPDFAPPVGWRVAGPPAGTDAPISARNHEKSWWFEALEDGGTVYFQWNAVQDDPGETFAHFCGRLFQYVDEAEADRLVIDLRRNGGGNNYLNQPLIHALIRRDRLDRPGHLFVLIGPQTFSAAVNAATDLERETQALFVGEPTGAGPNAYGDAAPIALPKSGLAVRCSTALWQKSDPRDARPWILPDLPAPASFADLLAGRDAALEAALSADPAEFETQPLLPPVGRWRRPSQSAPWPPAR